MYYLSIYLSIDPQQTTHSYYSFSPSTHSYILDQILSGKSREEVVDNIHSYLQQKSHEIRNGVIPLKGYIITKGLTKAPEDYPDSKGQPHVQVALKMKQSVCRYAIILSYYHPVRIILIHLFVQITNSSRI